jgi:hypothetical protein
MVITPRLLHLRRLWLTHLLILARDTLGLAAIGIRQGPATPGGQATGLGPLIRMPIGLVRATTGTVTTADTGGGDYQADLSFHTSRVTTLALPPCS